MRPLNAVARQQMVSPEDVPPDRIGTAGLIVFSAVLGFPLSVLLQMLYIAARYVNSYAVPFNGSGRFLCSLSVEGGLTRCNFVEFVRSLFLDVVVANLFSAGLFLVAAWVISACAVACAVRCFEHLRRPRASGLRG